MFEQLGIARRTLKKRTPSYGIQMAMDEIVKDDGLITVFGQIFAHVRTNISGPSDHKYILHCHLVLI